MTEKITYVEIDLNRCSNDYGVSPCTASGPAVDKCFNCFATCQDKDNYVQETVTSRHSSVTSKPPIDIDAVPDLQSYSIRPAQLDLGESIGTRASVSLSFKDSRYPDTGPEGDYYLTERDYDPYTVGTYWGKFRARYPFIKAANIRLIRGDTTQSIEQMETRHFIIDSVAGPDSSGKFTITCKDALKLADGKKAQAPVLSNGEIAANITDSATSLTLTPSGIGDSEYPASGYINLGGEEICSFTRAADVMTIVRGQYNTSATDHDEGARVQLCLEYSAQIVTDIINDLLADYANVPSSYIPLVDWNGEDSTYINRTYSALIPEPESVTDLVNELLQQTASNIWWDDINKLMQFSVLKAVDTDATTYSDNLILADSFSAKDQNNKRVSQVWTYFGQINPLEDLKKNFNYSRTQINVNLESETNFDGTPSIKRIYSRWIDEAAREAAERLNELVLSRYATPPRLLGFTLQRAPELTRPALAGGYNVENWTLQTDKGFAQTVPVQVTQMKSTDANFIIQAEEVLYSETVAPVDPQEKAVEFATDEETDIDLYAKALAGAGSNTPPEVGDTWTFTVKSGVTIGSTSTGTYAIETGVWPAGITVKLVNNGTIVGKGGAGGAASVVTGPVASNVNNGTSGGDSVNASSDLEITNNGVIGGGGGGGGSAVGQGGPFFGALCISAGSNGAGFTLNAIPVAEYIDPFDNGFFPTRTVISGNQSTDQLGGVEVFASSIYESHSSTATGGKGGDLGADGSDGAYTQSSSAGSSDVSDTATGGAAGSAINKNGNTVTITNNGQILGDINA